MKRAIGILLAGALLLQPLPVLADGSTSSGALTSIGFNNLKDEILNRNLTIKSTGERIDNGHNDIYNGISGLKLSEAQLDASCDNILTYFSGKNSGLKAESVNKATLISYLPSSINQSKIPDNGYIIKDTTSGTVYAATMGKDTNGQNMAGKGFLWLFLNNMNSPNSIATISIPVAGVPSSVDVTDITKQMNDSLDYMNLNLLKLYQGQIASIESQISTLNSQYDDNGKADLQNSKAANQITWGAQQVYLSYNDLKAQADNMTTQMQLLRNQINIENIQLQLGMTTSLNVKSDESKLHDLALGLNTMNENIQWLKGSLNNMLGQDYESNLTINGNPVVTESDIKSLDYNNDLINAQTWNVDVVLKVKSQSDADVITNADSEDIQNIKLKIALDFDKAYKGVLDKQKVLENEKAKLDVEKQKFNQLQLQHDLGLVSNIAFEAGKLPYDNQQLKVTQAQTALLKAYTQYKWLVDGMDFISTEG